MDKKILEEEARAFILSYCNISVIPKDLEFIVSRMVEEMFNRAGSDGITSRGVLNANESYLTDFSSQIYKILNRYRRIKTSKKQVIPEYPRAEDFCF